MSQNPESRQIKISVMISCYKEGALVLKAIESLKTQIDHDFETIVVNDASTDNETINVCRSLQLQGLAKVLWRTQNGGPGIARATAFTHMEGNIAVPLDADDTLPPNAIADIRKAFVDHPDADFVFGDYIRNDLDKGERRFVSCKSLCNASGWLEPKQLRGDWILLGTSPCTKNMWIRVRGGDSHFSRDLHDVDVQMKSVALECKGYYIDKHIYTWNRSSTGTNASVKKGRMRELYLRNAEFFESFLPPAECIQFHANLKHWLRIKHYASKSFLKDPYQNWRMAFWAILPVRLIKYIFEHDIDVSLSKVRRK